MTELIFQVVDLYGSSSDTRNKGKYNGDSLQVVYSSSKSLTAIAIASLVDKKLLRYEDKVCYRLYCVA